MPVAELIVDVAQVRRELSPELWPRDDPAWARLLVGQSVELLDVLAAMPEVLEPAIAGEQISPADEVPEDPGDASLDGLHAGWAARTNELELERVAHWATKPPDVPRLPLLRSFAADFHDFLLDRVRLHFAYLKGERLPLVERAQLQDAGFVAVTEQRRRLQEPEPAEVHLERIVLGLRARAAGIAREQG